mgnify:CR=1 FL=1
MIDASQRMTVALYNQIMEKRVEKSLFASINLRASELHGMILPDSVQILPFHKSCRRSGKNALSPFCESARCDSMQDFSVFRTTNGYVSEVFKELTDYPGFACRFTRWLSANHHCRRKRNDKSIIHVDHRTRIHFPEQEKRKQGEKPSEKVRQKILH